MEGSTRWRRCVQSFPEQAAPPNKLARHRLADGGVVRRCRHLSDWESAPFETAGLLLILPALGSLGAAVSAVAVLDGDSCDEDQNAALHAIMLSEGEATERSKRPRPLKRSALDVDRDNSPLFAERVEGR